MAETDVAQPAAETRIPWYSLNPRHLRFSKFTWWVIVIGGLLILPNLVSVKPLWQFGWRQRLYCIGNRWPVTSARGQKIPAGAWTKAKTILVYGAPGIDHARIEAAADGMRSLVDEIGLDFTIKQVDAPKDAVAAITQATVQEAGETVFDFDAFEARRLDDRGSTCAEIVVVNTPFKDPGWAWGLTFFPSGLAVLQEDSTSYDLGRHEGAHLLGYDKHDDMPLYVLGYRESLQPSERDTLMMLLPKASSDLSPRARDALDNFWIGMEARDGVRYQK